MANRYWVGGTGNWDSSDTSHWSSTTGGSSGSSVPTSSDNVFFDGSSGGGTVTVSSSTICLDLNFTNFTGTFTRTSSPVISIYGNLILSGSTTYSFNSAFEFRGNSNNTITSNGTYVPCRFGLNKNSYKITLNDNLTCSSLVLTTGTFDANDFDVTVLGVGLTVLNTSTIYLGNGNWYFAGSTTVVLLQSGITLYSENSTLKFTSSSSGSLSLIDATGKTFNNIWLSSGTNTGTRVLLGSNTYNNIRFSGTGIRQVKFTDGTTTTVSSITADSAENNNLTLTGTSTAGWTISDSTGINRIYNTTVAYSTATGGATWNSKISDGNTDGGNNTGWNFISIYNLTASTGAFSLTGINNNVYCKRNLSTSTTSFSLTGISNRFVRSLENITNIYADDGSYSTLYATSGILTVEVSKDAGVNWQVSKTLTFTSSDSVQTCGTGSTELWGTSWTRADMTDTNFRIRLSHGNTSQVYKNFGFTTGSDILTGLEVAIDGKYASSTISLDHLKIKIYYGTSILPVQAGSQAFASNGRKAGEGAGAGSGLLVYYDGSNWIASDTGATVAA